MPEPIPLDLADSQIDLELFTEEEISRRVTSELGGAASAAVANAPPVAEPFINAPVVNSELSIPFRHRGKIVYVPNRRAFFNSATNRYVSRSELLAVSDAIATENQATLARHAQDLVDARITVSEWQSLTRESITRSALLAGYVAAGGVDHVRTNESIRKSLRDAMTKGLVIQDSKLQGFAEQASQGLLSQGRFRARTAHYGLSSRTFYYGVEHAVLKEMGFTEARRDLDPLARSCISCQEYDTGDEWLPIDQVVPPATECECFSRCRCFIFYR